MSNGPRLLTLTCCLFGACHSAAPAKAPAPEAAPAFDLAAVPSPPVPWADMDAVARKAWMNDVVVPVMEPLWLDYDGERFADFGCSTCHGEDPRAREFAMPHGGILALHPTGSAEQQQMVKDHPRMVRFMFNRVVPAMQKLLGAAEFDAESGEGFSCYACHPSALASD